MRTPLVAASAKMLADPRFERACQHSDHSYGDQWQDWPGPTNQTQK